LTGSGGHVPGPRAVSFQTSGEAVSFSTVSTLTGLSLASQEQAPAPASSSVSFAAFVDKGKTPAQVCSDLLRRDKGALIKQCQDARDSGGFVDNPWNAAPRDFCVQERFEKVCRDAYQSLLTRAYQARSGDASQICDYEAGVNAQFVKGICTDKAACNSHFSEACSTATKQYGDCVSFFTEPDFELIAKLLCADFKGVESAAVLHSSAAVRPSDSLPVDIAVRKQEEKGLQDLDKLELSVFAEKIKERETVGDYVLYDASVKGARAGQLFALRPVSDAGLDYAGIAFATQDEKQSTRAVRATDSLTSFYLDPSRGGVYGIASYLAFKKKIFGKTESLRKIDESEASKDFYYKLGLLIAGNPREYDEAQSLRSTAAEIKTISGEVRYSAPAAGDLVSTARLFSLGQKTKEFELELRREARRKEDISQGFVPWFARWVARCGGLCTSDEEYG